MNELPRRLPLVRAVATCRRAFVCVAGISFGINLLMLASPLYMMQIYDRVIATRHIDTLILLALITAVAFATLASLEILRSFSMNRLASWLDPFLSGPSLTASLNATLDGSRASAQALRDVATLRSFLTGPAVFPLFDMPWTPLFLVIIFTMHPLLGWISFWGMALLLTLGIVNERITRQPLRNANSLSIRAFDDADQIVRNADAIAAMGMISAVESRWQDSAVEINQSQRLAADRGALVAAAARLTRVSLQAAILTAGGWLVIQHEISGGVMIAAMVMMGRAVAPAEQAMTTWKALVGTQTAFRRLHALLQRAPIRASEVTQLPRPNGRLVADKATIIWPDARDPVLKSVSFAAKPGDCVAVVGSSGAGKTTLIRLLIGSLRPTAGAVRLAGVDIAVWDSADRGAHVGYLPQNVELLSGTVRDNIARFSTADDKEVIAAAQLAGAHEMILRLPGGYDTSIGRGGLTLSGGQRQQIGLARALLRSPRLIVLDEPDAHLDANGERALIEAMKSLRASGAILIVATHQTRLLAHMDKILVLRDGAVEAFGSRDEVLVRLHKPHLAAV